jgi:hypothetical protein
MDEALKPKANQRVDGPVKVSVTLGPMSNLAVMANPAVDDKFTTPVV